MAGFVSQRGMGSSSGTEVRIEDIHRYLQNPYQHITQIRNTSTYLTNKHGVLRDVIRMARSLPTLKYGLNWSSLKEDLDVDKHEHEVNNFLDGIDAVGVVRDGLSEVAELGTVVMCLRSKKYVQFLDLEDVVINKQRNGRWVVEFDLKSLDVIRDFQEKLQKIGSLPDEVSVGRYNRYKKSNDEKLRYVEIKNCEVISLDARRNSPFGLPMTIGSWLPILQKEVINKVERSVSDRLVKQILILSAGHMDKDGTRPAPKELIDFYFKEVSSLIQQKDGHRRNNSGDNSGTGVVAFPDMFKLDALEVDTTLFKKELYDKIDNDIFMNLGISQALVYGEGGNYSSAMANSEKFFSFIFSLVEQFESALNRFLQLVAPNDLICKIKFDKSTVLDKQTEIANRKELYMQTNLLTPWIEAVMDAPISDIIELRKREEKLNLEELFYPAQNAYTTSSGEAGRPASESPSNDSTDSTKSNDGNNNPSPSD